MSHFLIDLSPPTVRPERGVARPSTGLRTGSARDDESKGAFAREANRATVPGPFDSSSRVGLASLARLATPRSGRAEGCMSHFFIDRPIFASVLSIVLTIAGAL